MKHKIAIFASGKGSNAQKIITHFKNSELARVALVIANKPKAGVLQIAEKEHIPTLIFNKADMSRQDFLLSQLKERDIDLLVLAGFLWKIPGYLIARYPDCIINIHPALLPKYGGKGMYGAHVHAAVLAAGEKESGITIHYVNEHYDEGKIILQKKCPVSATDNVESLAQKVQQLEHYWFPLAIEKVFRQMSNQN